MRSRFPGSTGILLLAALAGVFGCGGASAATTFRLDLSGTVVHVLNCWEDPNFCNPDLPPPADQITPWSGHLDLALATNGDGTFIDPDLLSMTFAANIGGFSVPGASPPPSPDRLWPFFGSVTIVHGRVTSVDGAFVDFFSDDFDSGVRFSGMTVRYHDGGGHHTGPTDAVGTLALEVPEPATWLQWLAPLALLAAGRGRVRFRRSLVRR